jgi:two-component system, OmpR family, KDP operon response regulator KdpE
MAYKILLVDDDPDLCKLLTLKLESTLFDIRVAGNGLEGLQLAYEYQPDLIILDVMMPEMDGFEACKRLRELSNVPIILLTAKCEEKDVLHGFESGADDYIRKPFSRNELSARIMAVLSRKHVQDSRCGSYNDGCLSIDLDQQMVYKQGIRIHLTKIEFRLLSHLLSRQGTVVSHAALLRGVWGSGYKEAKSLLSLYIRYLRQKIEDDPNNPQYIRTEWGIGYWFAPIAPAYKFSPPLSNQLPKFRESLQEYKVE